MYFSHEQKDENKENSNHQFRKKETTPRYSEHTQQWIGKRTSETDGDWRKKSKCNLKIQVIYYSNY